MSATSIDLSQIKTDALSAASTFRTLIGLGTLATQSPTGTANNTTYLRGDFTWQTISSGGTWGSITGTLSSQTDLQSALDAKASLTGATFTGAVGINAGTLNGTVLDISQTWGGTGTYTGIKYNVTDSGPANAASLLMDLQVGGVSRTSISKDGILAVNGPASGTITHSINSLRPILVGRPANVVASRWWPQINLGAQQLGPGFYTETSSTSAPIIVAAANKDCMSFSSSELRIASDICIGFQDNTYVTSGTVDTKLFRDAANTLAQRNGTNAQTFRIYNTYTDASNYERAKIAWSSNVLQIGTEKLGTGAARALELQTDGTTRLTIGTDGVASLSAGRLNFTSSGIDTFISHTATMQLSLGINNAARLRIGTDGVRLLDTGADFGWSDAALYRSSATVLDTRSNGGLRVRNYANSADADITAAKATLSATLDLTIRTVTYGATMAIDAALGNKIAITLTGNGTISNPTNAVDGRVLVFRLRQDGSGNRVPVWDTKYTFVGDLATVTLSTAANKIDRVAFEYDSTDDKWYCISFIKGS